MALVGEQMHIEISELQKEDRAALRDLLREFDTLRGLDILELDCYINHGQCHPSQWHVARTTNGELIGCVNASIRSGEGYISSLSVRKEFRGRGTGKMLVKNALCYLKELGCKSVFLYVRPKNNIAKAFYEKLGFANFGLTKSQNLEDVFLMRKRI